MDLFSSLVQVARGQLDELLHTIADEGRAAPPAAARGAAAGPRDQASGLRAAGRAGAGAAEAAGHAAAGAEPDASVSHDTFRFLQGVLADMAYAKRLFKGYARVLQQRGEPVPPLSEHQSKHARSIIQAMPALDQLRFELCPSHMSDDAFWRVYFGLLQEKQSVGASKDDEDDGAQDDLAGTAAAAASAAAAVAAGTTGAADAAAAAAAQEHDGGEDDDVEERTAKISLGAPQGERSPGTRAKLLFDLGEKDSAHTPADFHKGIKRERDDVEPGSGFSDDLAIVSRLFFSGAKKTLQMAEQFIEGVDDHVGSRMGAPVPPASSANPIDAKLRRTEAQTTPEAWSAPLFDPSHPPHHDIIGDETRAAAAETLGTLGTVEVPLRDVSDHEDAQSACDTDGFSVSSVEDGELSEWAKVRTSSHREQDEGFELI